MDRRVLSIVLLLLVLAISVPAPQVAAQACDGTEDFEDDTNFQAPTGCWYTTSTMGTTVVNTLRPYEGTKSLAVPVGAAEPRFTVSPAESVCVNGVPFTLSFYVNFDAVTHRWDGFFGTTQFGFRVNTGTTAFILITPSGSPTIPDLVIAADTWYGLSMTVSCSATAGSDDAFGTAWLASNPTGTVTGASVSDQDWGTAANVIGFGMAASGPKHWIDNIEIGPYDDSKATFCADQTILDYDGNAATPTGGTDDYGYDFRRGGDYFDQSVEDLPATGPGLSTGYSFFGSPTESTWDYAAKHLLVPSKAMHANVTIEAGTESVASIFRVNFHTQATTNPDGGVNGKGNGLNTGHFSDHVEAQFEEDSDHWRLTFWYVNAGGTRTQLLGAINYGDANDATSFTVWIDTRATANGPPDSYFGATPVVAGPYIAVTVPQAAGGEPYTVLGFRSLAGISSNVFLEDSVNDVWHVGYGGAGLVHAGTYLDNNEDGQVTEARRDSTCIFDDAGTAVFANSQGATPGSLVPGYIPPVVPVDDDCSSGAFCVDATTTPVGFTETTFRGFLGICLIAGVVGVGRQHLGKTGAVIGVFSCIGILLAFYMGYIDTWVIVVAVILSLGAFALLRR